MTLTLNTYSHVMGTTAHEQIAKINKLFAQKEQKPSVTKQLTEAKEQLKGADKSPMKNKNRNDQEL